MMFNSTLASEYTLKAPAFAVERQRAAVLMACLARLVSEVWTVHFIPLQSLRFWTAHFSHLCSLSRVPGQKKKKKLSVGLLISFSLLRRQCALSHRNVFAPQSDANVKCRPWHQCDAIFFLFVLCLPRFGKCGRELLMSLYRVCFKTINVRFTLPLFSPAPLYVLTVLKEV